ncbi:hypothetical protein Bbelb_007670 [Branchiostoma belcheri]|nr:hypothetical protein Bbelb_007670 [Branchiostoma belcheri]
MNLTLMSGAFTVRQASQLSSVPGLSGPPDRDTTPPAARKHAARTERTCNMARPRYKDAKNQSPSDGTELGTTGKKKERRPRNDLGKALPRVEGQMKFPGIPFLLAVVSEPTDGLGRSSTNDAYQRGESAKVAMRERHESAMSAVSSAMVWDRVIPRSGQFQVAERAPALRDCLVIFKRRLDMSPLAHTEPLPDGGTSRAFARPSDDPQWIEAMSSCFEVNFMYDN